jgi:hypothetical protein
MKKLEIKNSLRPIQGIIKLTLRASTSHSELFGCKCGHLTTAHGHVGSEECYSMAYTVVVGGLEIRIGCSNLAT